MTRLRAGSRSSAGLLTAARRAMAAALASLYMKALTTAPALTKYCTTFWICCASVYLSQKITDTVSLRKIVSYSAVVGAPPYSHYWFLLLERMGTGTNTMLVLDQLAWRPLTIAWSFLVGAYLEDGSLKNLGANMKGGYKKAVTNGLILWVPLQYINFRFVPMRWRVLFIDAVHFFWDIYLCTISMAKKSQKKLDTPKPAPKPTGGAWVRKYFTEDHERMLNRMVPPADADAGPEQGLDTLPALADATAPAAELSGSLFAQLLVDANMDRLNKENEFPIPDADTGTNMVICFKKAVRRLVEETAKAGPDCSLIAATEGFADDVVMNGQGNSGTILSHFFKTLADEIKKLGKPTITAAELATVLDATGAAMANAVPTVFEGTMISCARDGAAGLGATEHATVQALCAAWTAKTSEACLATHTTLEKDGKKVLEGQKGLDGGPKVDSGASGFLMIVQGMSMACDGTLTAEQMKDASEINPVGMTSEAGLADQEARGDLPEYPFQYCTECAINLKPGTSEDEVKSFFEEYQTDGNCDSMACVCTSTLAKLHVHTNDPGAVFKLAQEHFSVDDILLKEKVEDMYIERDQATQGPAYDMSKAKVHVMCDAVMLPYHEMDHATILPVWIIDGIEPRILGDPRVNVFDVANGNRQFFAKHGLPKKLDTAAPTPEQVELQMRKALDKCENSQATDILVITLSSMMSAMHRNVCNAAGQSADCQPLPDGGNCSLPEEARKRIHIYDSGYLGPNDLMAREAMRCAEKGMTFDEIMERIKYVENRLYSFFVVTSATKKKLATWGRVFANLKGEKMKPEDVVDGEVCSHGIRPGPDGMAKGKIGEFVCGASRLLPAGSPAPPQAMKAMNTFAPLAAVPDTGSDAVATLIAVELDAIKANLKPGQKLMDVCVGTPIRQDVSIEIGKQIKAALPVEGEVTVVDTLVIPALCQYGEMLVTYWIEDGPEP